MVLIPYDFGPKSVTAGIIVSELTKQLFLARSKLLSSFRTGNPALKIILEPEYKVSAARDAAS